MKIYSYIFFQELYTFVVKCKFMCPMHSEVKQTKTSEFGPAKDLLQSEARRMGGSCSKTPNSPVIFWWEVFIGNIWDEGYRVYDFLLIRLWWGSRVVLQEPCAQPQVAILHLGEGLSSYRITQRYCYVYLLRRNQDPVLIAALLFLDCSSFVSAFPPFLG